MKEREKSWGGIRASEWDSEREVGGRGAPEIDREPGRARGPGFRIRVQGQGQQRARHRAARSEPVVITAAPERHPLVSLNKANEIDAERRP